MENERRKGHAVQEHERAHMRHWEQELEKNHVEEGCEDVLDHGRKYSRTRNFG